MYSFSHGTAFLLRYTVQLLDQPISIYYPTIIEKSYIYIYIYKSCRFLIYKIHNKRYIRLSEEFLSFHKVIMDEQQFLFYIILLN